ncbi:E3 ubiquitin-protein ligase SHPRH isoform X2 [Leptinotarsa decemlineata]|uniref:E3 ubiquitin-protein ligase SHPRH isoform X2 n=1 Tax=Leptinotarsa decemlineata TaxID=7539 RepID=UPI003D30B01A
MGRQKNIPYKIAAIEDNCNYRDYIPVSKKRKRKSHIKKSMNRFFNVELAKTEQKQFYIGELLIGETNNIFPSEYTDCRVSFKILNDDDRGNDELDTIILECDKVSMVIIKIYEDINFLKDLFTLKIFCFDFSVRDEKVYLSMYFKALPLPTFHSRIGNCIKTLFSLIYEIDTNTTEDEESSINENRHGGKEIVGLYEKLWHMRKTNDLANFERESVLHPNLKPSLRPYQENSVRWMLSREKNNTMELDQLQPLYTPLLLKSDLTIYLDKYSGYVTLERPVIAKSSQGGILADEMGLGKTVEVLACILLNPKNQVSHEIEQKDSATDLKPVVVKQLQKRKMPVDEEEEASSILHDRSKKLKIPNNWVKTSSKKSSTYVALKMWYDSILSDVSTTSSSAVDEDRVSIQCICGSRSEDGIIECDCCGKYQHRECLGYNKSLGRYLCPQCWMDEPLLECGATLIVTPLTLRSQWSREICKHIRGKLKVLQYDGCNLTPVYPTQLKEYDIVITTYSVLQNELRLTENVQAINLRRERKYSPQGSPLTRIKWWRLCLDEAQTVDTPGRMVSEMAGKINAVHRWAVTGTPISKNISDLYGLIDYIQITPFNDLTTWNKILYEPYVKGNDKPMLEFLSKVLWRTSKKDVLDQINIPKQTYREHLLEFSAVEKYFYRREHELICSDFLSKVSKFDLTLLLDRLDRSTLKKLLDPLYTLRHACTHPNTSRGRYLATKKQVTSMKDLLNALIVKNTNDSEDCLRLIISSLNGKLVARFSGEQGEIKLTVDKPQVIHTLYNLAEVLDNFKPDQPTLRDGNLRNDCKDLEEKYMEKFISESTTAFESFSGLMMQVEKLRNKLTLKDGQWYSDGMDWTLINGYFDNLLDRIKTSCDGAGVPCNLNIFRSSSERKILQLLYSWDDDLSYLRSKLFEAIDELYEYVPEGIHKIIIKDKVVIKAMNCHLRPQKKSKQAAKCLVCEANVQLKMYEGKLFSMTHREKNFEDMSLKGSWKSTLEELIMKSLLALLKSKNSNPEYIQDGEVYINIIECLKKEFKELRKLWTFLDQQICAQDELDICKVRLQLKTEVNDEKKDNKVQNKVNKALKNLNYQVENRNEFVNLLSVHELDFQMTSLKNEYKMNTASLEKLLGTQSYLETLRKQQYEGQSPDPCPICKNALEQHWSILLCGHSYCLECIQVLLEQTSGDHIQCSVCRNKQKYEEISYIKAGNTVTDEDCKKIKGNYSTKIEAVIKLLTDLREEHPDVKVLLFSSWITVLKCLRSALQCNSITCELLSQGGNVEAKIKNFKDPTKNITVLLLPINLGSKGLNLIEATHVILVEPLLNPADELQAIGRVNRIGQTKPTFVHKFLIKNTIEESIHQATTSNAENWDKSKVTLQHLVNLFDTSVEAVESQNSEVSPTEILEESTLDNDEIEENINSRISSNESISDG